MGISNDKFQIPNLSGQQPSLGLDVNGQTAFPSQNLNENQTEVTDYGIMSWQHSEGALNWQTSFTARYSSLTFTPDPVGDLLYNGVAQYAFKRDRRLRGRTMARTSWPTTIRCAPASTSSMTGRPANELLGAADRCNRRPAQRRAVGRHRRRRADATDRERLSAGRVEDAGDAHRQLRSAFRSLLRFFQRQSDEPARQRGLEAARPTRPCTRAIPVTSRRHRSS